jgi:uncharacterized DUF497 family protein
MEIQRLIAQSEGFEWDSGNATKSWLKHRVKPRESEEVFYNVPLLLLHDDKHSHTETRYATLGKTDVGRLLLVIWTYRKKKIRVISARPMNAREKKLYGEES